MNTAEANCTMSDGVTAYPARIAVKVPEAAKMIGVCDKTMYNLIHTDGFPVMWIGRKPLIPVEGLREWVMRQSGCKEGRP